MGKVSEGQESKIYPPSVSGSLQHLDYKWYELSTDEVGKMLAEKLKQVGAKVWFMDVYCSNDSVYRNIIIKWPSYANIKEVAIRFNREDGTQLDIEKVT